MLHIIAPITSGQAMTQAIKIAAAISAGPDRLPLPPASLDR